jgi:hypothetical protein
MSHGHLPGKICNICTFKACFLSLKSLSCLGKFTEIGCVWNCDYSTGINCIMWTSVLEYQSLEC